MKIIPAIDLLDGKCVRLEQGNYSTSKVYNEDPLEMAKILEGAGLKYLHLVDLNGAKSAQIVHDKILYKIVHQTSLQVDFSGGIKTRQDLEIAFSAGAHHVAIGTSALKNKIQFFEWVHEFTSARIIFSADCLNGMIKIHGWLESTNVSVIDCIKEYQQHGVENVICTDISKDGMLAGPAYHLYQQILQNNSVNLIASGGISSITDVLQLQEIGCAGAIIGKAIYEGRIKLKDVHLLC